MQGLSSPVSLVPKSKFTYKHLAQMKQCNVESPLRIVAHIDLDAFYAQCEMVRLGVAEDQPLAVQQWSALIAINYPARKFGISRHLKVEEAKKLCPNLMAVHVATWRVTEADGAVCDYHPQTPSSISTDKVSLDHYRRESKKILAIFRANCPKVEKAGIDESFVDLSGMIYDVLMKEYKEELGVVDGVPVAPYSDATERLRLPEVGLMDWDGNHLVDLDVRGDEEDAIDWDDVAMSIGAKIVAGIRKEVRTRLGYTCSAGVARNKMLAKLGSAYQKPNQQTIVRNRAVAQFLSNMKFTKIRNLGGKLGEQVTGHFSTELLSEILPIPLETMKKKLDDDTGRWLYHTIRGIDKSEVNTRTETKSMLSAKSFRPDITKFEQGEAWLRVFVADIAGRITEMADEDDSMIGSQPVSLRRPKTMTLHHRHGQMNKTRQLPIPLGKPLEDEFLLSIAKTLLRQIEAEGRCWPCQNLSLAVGGFDDVGRGSNRGIGGWIVKGEQAKLVNEEATKRTHLIEDDDSKRKRRKPDIQQFFGGTSANKSEGTLSDDPFFVLDDDEEALLKADDSKMIDAAPRPRLGQATLRKTTSEDTPRLAMPPILRSNSSDSSSGNRKRFFTRENTSTSVEQKLADAEMADDHLNDENAFPCELCSNQLVKLVDFDKHANWHIAQNLAKEEQRKEHWAPPKPSSSRDNIRKFVAAQFGASRQTPEERATDEESLPEEKPVPEEQPLVKDQEDNKRLVDEDNTFPCPRCDDRPIHLDRLDEHINWHAAQYLPAQQTPIKAVTSSNTVNLQENQWKAPSSKTKSADLGHKGKTAGGPRKAAKSKLVEKGQMKLPFGK